MAELGMNALLHEPTSAFEPYRVVLGRVLEFIYTLATGIGNLVVSLIRMILPAANVPPELALPIGVLAILTIFLVLAEVARKLTWIVVAAGWLLVALGVALTLVGS